MSGKSSQGQEQPLRYRVTVPLQDADVINWMAAQASPSFSIRLLIRAIIAKYGITDVTCLPVGAGLDADVAGQAAAQVRDAGHAVNKSSTSLTDIRQGRTVLPRTPAPVVPQVQRQAPPPVVPRPGGGQDYVPKDIPDLM